MPAGDSNARPDAAPILTLVRIFAAPRELVWAAWTEPAQLRRWMGPRGFTSTHCEGDFRPGGRWRSCIREDATGREHWQSGVYREIEAPERLVFTFAWDGEDGRPGNQTLITIGFAEQDGKTVMTFRQEDFPSRESRDGHEGGWKSTFEKLDDLLAEGDAA